MKKAPEPGEDVHPLTEALQQLKFDGELNSPEELAEKYKEDGNYWMKHKKYRIAIMSYTEGIIQQKHENMELLANLFNNRSAAHFFIQNYRSSCSDAQTALKYKPDYTKAKLRILRCNLLLNKFDNVLEDVKKFISEDPTNKDFIAIQKQAKDKKLEKLRDERKIQMNEKKKRQKFQSLVQALIQRKVKFEEIELRKETLSNLSSFDVIRPTIDPLLENPVTLDKDGTIYWPVVFCYPEFSITDIQQQVHEMATLFECLNEMFSSDDQDKSQQNYKSPNQLNIYFENRLQGKMIKADSHKPIKDIISDERFWVYNGYLTFYVIPKDTKIEIEFLNQKRSVQCLSNS